MIRNFAIIALLASVTLPAAAVAQNSQNRQNNQSQSERSGSTQSENYGTWQSSWGSRPSAPPAHFKNKSDWYRHVRACQQRYPTYSASTDNYMNNGRATRCSL